MNEDYNEDYTIEIDSNIYNMDYDEAYPEIEEKEYQETDVLFE